MDEGLEAALTVFEPSRAAVARAGWDRAYASSGTVKMLKYICERQGYGENRITQAALRELKGTLRGGHRRRRIVAGIEGGSPGIGSCPGWCVAAALMQVFRVETLHFSATALREGMLDFLVRNEKTMPIMRTSTLPAVNRAS